MEMRSVRAQPAEERSAACEPPGDRTATMNHHDWEAGEAPGALAVQDRGPSSAAEPAPGELLRRLSALHLAEPAGGHRHNSGRMKPHFPDARYPLSTEESPRRRARSLPWNSIPEVDVEDDEDSLLCCCKLKKRVQFADSLGLSLASVKHFVPSDEPLVPPAVLARLQSYPPTAVLPQPGVLEESPVPAELRARLEGQRVCLEQVAASVWGVQGHILVKEPGQGAQVKIRYTFNEWLSFLDCPASAGQQSSAPGTQRFHFNLCYPPSTSLIRFAICFITGQGEEIWDNNQGVNYTVSCQHDLLPEPASPEPEDCEGPQLW